MPLMIFRCPGLFILAASIAVHAEVATFAEYHLGEPGSLASAPGGNTTTAPMDSSGSGRHISHINAGGTIGTGSSMVWATGSSAYAITSDSTHCGWYSGTTIFSALPADNFAFGVFARAADLGSAGSAFGLGGNGAFHVGLGSSGWGAWVSNGSGATASSWIGNSNGSAGSFQADHWVHLAVIRRSGNATFWINGVAQGGGSTVVPVHNTAHLSVDPSGSSAFDGHVDEARVVTFGTDDTDAEIFNALWGATELPPHPDPPVPVVVAEQVFPTVAGKRYIAVFSAGLAAGQSTLPELSLQVAGNGPLLNLALPATLPAGGNAAPFRVAFTADSATSTVKLVRLSEGGSPDPAIAGLEILEAIEPAPSNVPSAAQQAMIDRRYGMFIHYGINTFHNEQWTDGTKPPSSYAPTGLDVDQWVKTARDAGMSHIVLTLKHHEGFCMWDSPWTTYDVASASTPLARTDIAAAAAAACVKYGLGFGIYYSLWDRHEPSYGNDTAYNQYMLRQLAELMSNYGPICELWLDGGWEKANTRWANSEIYDMVKRLQPECLVTTNWSIGSPSNPDAGGVTPATQQAGYPIRYFPNDFRSADPHLPTFTDPKSFAYRGKNYYLPFESTITLSSANYWFYDTRDTGPKPIASLVDYFYSATAQDNVLIFNAPPDRNGVIREVDRQGLFQLRDALGLNPGMPLPDRVSDGATGSASATWNNDIAGLGPQKAFDGNFGSRWASGPAGITSATLEIDFGAVRSFDRLLIDEYEEGGAGRIQEFHLQAWDGSTWQTFHTGTTCGRKKLIDFPRQSTARLRLIIDSASNAPSIWEMQAFDSGHAFGAWRDSHFPGAGTDPAAAWDADPDDDGLSNRAEFVLMADPMVASALPSPVHHHGLMTLVVPWNPEAGDGMARLVFSEDLNEWFDARDALPDGIDFITGANERRWNIDPQVLPKWFYRIE